LLIHDPAHETSGRGFASELWRSAPP
jgi:hypothetical protein